MEIRLDCAELWEVPWASCTDEPWRVRAGKRRSALTSSDAGPADMPLYGAARRE